MRIAVVIPARDEEATVGAVVQRCRHVLPGAQLIVVDNLSADATAARAAAAGANVFTCAVPGYGHAAWAGTAMASADTDAYLYIDADGSMAPDDAPALLGPIAAGVADVVCGRRALRHMPWHQRAGNLVIAALLRRHGVRLSELGPFRAVRGSTVRALGLRGSRSAWAAEMLVAAARQGARVAEVRVGYGPRLGGRSKVGGSLRGSLQASWDIARALGPVR